MHNNKKVEILSRNVLLQKLRDHTIADIFNGEDFSVISISCVENDEDILLEKYPHFDTEIEIKQCVSYVKIPQLKDFMTLSCLDIVPGEKFKEFDEYLFTGKDAIRVHDFVHNTMDTHLIVHCTAGISRSAAIAQYAASVKGCYDDFSKKYSSTIFPNTHIAGLMRKLTFTENELPEDEYQAMLKLALERYPHSDDFSDIVKLPDLITANRFIMDYLNNEDCIDNDRFAFIDDEYMMEAYNNIIAEGCCGSSDVKIMVDGRLATIGRNYGH